MYHSGVSVAEAIGMLTDEVDIVGDIPASSFLRWVSSLEHLIYSDLLADERSADLVAQGDRVIPLSELSVADGEQIPTFDEVTKVYRDGEELTRAGLATVHQFGDDKAFYYKKGEALAVSVYGEGEGDTFTVVWRAIPAVKKSTDDEILVPYAWLDLVLAKLRGEAYKIANDDAQAAKWLGDFNAQMESFRLWASERRKRFGE